MIERELDTQRKKEHKPKNKRFESSWQSVREAILMTDITTIPIKIKHSLEQFFSSNKTIQLAIKNDISFETKDFFCMAEVKHVVKKKKWNARYSDEIKK